MLLSYISSFYKTGFFKQNKTIILLIFAWIFRLTFLLQGNAGGVAINKYVLLQIILGMIMFIFLQKRGVTPIVLLKYPSTRFFAILYMMGVISICWSVMPLMSCYFALENLILMTSLLYISLQCKDCYQAEGVFIWMILVILCMFLIRNLTIGGTWHSVTFSSIAAMLFMYCLAEYDGETHSSQNLIILKYGLLGAGFILIITTSGGACFSAALSSVALALFARKSIIRITALTFLIIIGSLWFSGATDVVLDLLFPGKNIENIMSAHGRAYVWELIYEKIAERPWFGWGYAAVERILPLYCIDAHNSIIGVRGSLGNIGCVVLITAMFSVCIYYFKHDYCFGSKGLLIASICAFINSNTTNFLAAKDDPCALTFQFLLVLGVAYSSLPLDKNKCCKNVA